MTSPFPVCQVLELIEFLIQLRCLNWKMNQNTVLIKYLYLHQTRWRRTTLTNKEWLWITKSLRVNKYIGQVPLINWSISAHWKNSLQSICSRCECLRNAPHRNGVHMFTPRRTTHIASLVGIVATVYVFFHTEFDREISLIFLLIFFIVAFNTADIKNK